MKTNHIAILIDRSGSTASIKPQLIAQFNAQAALIRDRSATEHQKTHLSLYTFESQADRPLLFEVPLDLVDLKPLTPASYETGGMTAMFDSIGMAVEDLQHFHRDLRSSDHSFLIIVLTDGQENQSRRYTAAAITKLMREKTQTDVWSFVFLVPPGDKRALVQSFGIPEGNVQEWGATARGMEDMGRSTSAALGNYFAARSSGLRSTKAFFTDLSKVSTAQVARQLTEVTALFASACVHYDESIRDFCDRNFCSAVKGYQTGNAYYELTKPETVQAAKKVVVENRHSGKRYSGPDARHLLGLPDGGEVRVRPGDHGDYRVFVQSTSVNRKLMAGTTVLYYKG